jgi:HNH endonuclease
MANNRYISVAVRRQTQERAQHCCEYCIASAHFNTDSFQFDHIIPRISGGTSDADNIAYSCGNCNLHKQDHTHHVDPLTGNFVRLFHPRQHRWTDHFCWSEDELTILGITDIARATIHLL